MKALFKYFPKTDIGSYLFASFLIALIFTVIILVSAKGNYEIAALFGIGIFILLFIYLFLSDHFGKKKHASIVHSKLFRELCNIMLFQIETHNNNLYWGLKGTYENYFFRIYYNWNTLLPNRNINREITIMLYFSPPLASNGSLDIHYLDSLNNKYREKGLFKPTNFETRIAASYIQINRGYTIFTNYYDIADQIKRALEIVSIEKLQPIGEKEVNALIKENMAMHCPIIETFHNNFRE